MKKLLKISFMLGIIVGAGITAPLKVKAVTANYDGLVYRVYNPNSGEHLYTMNAYEVESLVQSGWQAEGALGKSYYNIPYDKPVYRLYSKNSGQHLYTTSTYEIKVDANYGWVNEGIVFYSSYYSNSDSGYTTSHIWRLYNPNSGQHFYTAEAGEVNHLVSLGWKSEGTAFQFPYLLSDSEVPQGNVAGA